MTGVQTCALPIWLLHIDKHGVVYRIAVEAGHDGQIAHILFTLKQFFDALLDAICDFP